MNTQERFDWPYPDADIEDEPAGEPTWECPEGVCECHPIEVSDEPRQFTVLLCDEEANPMAGARCRVLYQGRVVNESAPNADGEGWITIDVPRPPRTVTIEWAPKDTPLERKYPFRRRYYVDLDEKNDRESQRRRLHNLGFSSFATLEGNISDFKRAFDYDNDTGELDDIREDLIEFHDEAGVPSIDDDGPLGAETTSFLGFAAGPRRSIAAKTTRKKKPTKGRVPPPATETPTGGGNGAGVGAARPPAAGLIEVVVASMFAQPLVGSSTSTRWAPLNSHFVPSATFKLFDSSNSVVAAFDTANSSKKTDSSGKTKLDLRAVADGIYVLRVNPPSGHELRGSTPGPLNGAARANALLPVGPNDNFTSDAANACRFRIVEVTIELQGGALKRADVVKDMWKFPEAMVAHCAAFVESTSLLWIDWKPDWVRIMDHSDKPATTGPSGGPLSNTQFVILHETTAGTPGSTLNDFTTQANTGAHYLVDVDGHVIKMAPESKLVQHTAESTWFDITSDPLVAGHIGSFNALCVGIEQVHDGAGSTGTFPLVQVAATKGLVERLRAVFGIKFHNVLGHNEIKDEDSRANCPGFQLEWPLLENSGNATKPGSGAIPATKYGGTFAVPGAVINNRSPSGVIVDLQTTLKSLGYNAVIDGDFGKVERWLTAFQNRYFAGQANSAARAAFTKGKHRVADLATVQRMHDVLAARGGFKY